LLETVDKKQKPTFQVQCKGILNMMLAQNDPDKKTNPKQQRVLRNSEPLSSQILCNLGVLLKKVDLFSSISLQNPDAITLQLSKLSQTLYVGYLSLEHTPQKTNSTSNRTKGSR
jgi:hypothetical protein